jgi:hypothetical protein
LKTILLLLALLSAAHITRAQKADSIRFNLYTDSLKKGTWNYINIEIRFSNGRYLPAASDEVILTSSDGKVEGTSIWLPPGFTPISIYITAKLKSNNALAVSKTLYIKQLPDSEKLKSPEELLRELEQNGKKNDSAPKRKKRRGRQP